MGQVSPRIQTRHRILVVDDHPAYRLGLRIILEAEPDLEFTCEADSVAGAFDAIQEFKPSLALVDLSLRERTGFDLMREMKARNIQLPILVISAHQEPQYAVRSLRAGALGYVWKLADKKEILTAIRTVLNKQMYVCATMQQTVFTELARTENSKENALAELSDRELHVFELIAQGCTLEEISKRAFLSINTVRTYRERICHKLGFGSVKELERYAAQWYESEGPF